MRDIKCHGTWDTGGHCVRGEWRLVTETKDKAKEWHAKQYDIPFRKERTSAPSSQSASSSYSAVATVATETQESGTASITMTGRPSSSSSAHQDVSTTAAEHTSVLTTEPVSEIERSQEVTGSTSVAMVSETPMESAASSTTTMTNVSGHEMAEPSSVTATTMGGEAVVAATETTANTTEATVVATVNTTSHKESMAEENNHSNKPASIPQTTISESPITASVPAITSQTTISECPTTGSVPAVTTEAIVFQATDTTSTTEALLSDSPPTDSTVANTTQTTISGSPVTDSTPIKITQTAVSESSTTSSVAADITQVSTSTSPGIEVTNSSTEGVTSGNHTTHSVSSTSLLISTELNKDETPVSLEDEIQNLVNLFAPYKLRQMIRMENRRRERIHKEEQYRKVAGELPSSHRDSGPAQIQELSVQVTNGLHLSQSFIKVRNFGKDATSDKPYKRLPVFTFWKGYFTVRFPQDSSDKKIEEKFFLQLDRNANPEAKFVRVDGIGSNSFGRFELTGQYEVATQCVRLTKQYRPLQASEISENEAIMYSAGPTSTSTATATATNDVDIGRRKSERRKRVSSSVFGDEYINPHMRKRDSDDGEKEEYSDVPRDVSDRKRKADAKRYSTLCKKPRKEDRSKHTNRSSSSSSVKPYCLPDSATSTSVSDSYPIPRQYGPAMREFTADISDIKSKVVGGSESRKIQDQHNQAQTARKQARVASREALHFESTEGDDKIWKEAHRLPQGSGRLTGDLYEGEMQAGLPHGYGTVVYLNGWMFEGHFYKGTEYGWGVLTDENDVVLYEGELVDGELHGYGHMYYENGSKYCGCWKDGLFHGNGSFYQQNGGSYEGNWKEGYRHGYGTIYYVDGSSYSGQWVNDVRQGAGEYYDSSGFRYKGEWANSLPDGKGRATYPDGGVYEGTFRKGKRDGRGTLHFPGGATYTGRWKDDKMEGTGTVDTPHGVNINDDMFFIPVNIQADMKRIHHKAGFTASGD